MFTNARLPLALLALLSALGCGGANAAPPPPAAPSQPAPAASPPPPPQDPDVAAVTAGRPQLTACYDKARQANPNLGKTRVTVSLRVDETGKVTTVNLDYDHRFDEASKGCMRDAAFALQLPAGQPRRVEVPLVFDAH